MTTALAELFESLSMVEEICARHGLTLALHHHYGTVIERDDQLRRFLEGCETGLCLDIPVTSCWERGSRRDRRAGGDRVSHVHLKDVERTSRAG